MSFSSSLCLLPLFLSSFLPSFYHSICSLTSSSISLFLSKLFGIKFFLNPLFVYFSPCDFVSLSFFFFYLYRSIYKKNVSVYISPSIYFFLPKLCAIIYFFHSLSTSFPSFFVSSLCLPVYLFIDLSVTQHLFYIISPIYFFLSKPCVIMFFPSHFLCLTSFPSFFPSSPLLSFFFICLSICPGKCIYLYLLTYKCLPV